MSLRNFLSHYPSSPAYIGRHNSIIDKVQYDDYIRKLYDLFGRDRVKVVFLEDLKNDFQSFTSSVYKFLDVNPIPIEGKKENTGLGYYEANLLRFFNFLCMGSYNQAPIYIFSSSTQSKASALMHRLTRRRKRAKNVVKKALPAHVDILTDDGIEKESPANLIRESNKKLSNLIGRDLGELGYEMEK